MTPAAGREATGRDTGDAQRHDGPVRRQRCSRAISVDALTRQQQRIVHRSALMDYVIAAEKRSGQPLTLGDALAELLADITEAARTIGTILQAAGNGRP